jgi:hypothetical protein
MTLKCARKTQAKKQTSRGAARIKAKGDCFCVVVKKKKKKKKMMATVVPREREK